MIIQKSKKFENSLESIVLYIAKDSKNRALSFQRRLNKINKELSHILNSYPLNPKLDEMFVRLD